MFWLLMLVGAARLLLGHDPYRPVVVLNGQVIGYGHSTARRLVRFVQADRDEWIAECNAGPP